MLEPPEGYHWELNTDIMHDTQWVLVRDYQPGQQLGTQEWIPACLIVALIMILIFELAL